MDETKSEMYTGKFMCKKMKHKVKNSIQTISINFSFTILLNCWLIFVALFTKVWCYHIYKKNDEGIHIYT